jgi:hypothetical protein
MTVLMHRTHVAVAVDNIQLFFCICFYFLILCGWQKKNLKIEDREDMSDLIITPGMK